MKLAEVLNLRADLQKRIANLRERLIKNDKVQEGIHHQKIPICF